MIFVNSDNTYTTSNYYKYLLRNNKQQPYPKNQQKGNVNFIN